MHIERMQRLVNHLRELPEKKYNQEVFCHPCGTPACVAGHAVGMMLAETEGNVKRQIRPEDINIAPLDAERHAVRWLDLTLQQAERLFSPWPKWSNSPNGETTTEEAANEAEAMIAEERVK